MLGKAYALFIIYINLFAAITVLFLDMVGVVYCAMSAICMMSALFLIKDFSNE